VRNVSSEDELEDELEDEIEDGELEENVVMRVLDVLCERDKDDNV